MAIAKNKHPTYPALSKAFMIMEATSTIGGFAKYMNDRMDTLKQEMVQGGVPGPYKWKFAGGDGYAVPVQIVCYKD